jgi:hypothetical protein
MNVALRIQQYVVGLDVPVHNALLMYVTHGAAKLRYPEAHGFFSEGFARNVKAQISTRHQIDYNVTVQR